MDGPADADSQQSAAQVKKQDSGELQKAAKTKKLTWVGVRLVDQDKRPVANERYRIVLPDGSTREGQLDSSGEAWLAEIVPGNCQITFPNLDAREWSA